MTTKSHQPEFVTENGKGWSTDFKTIARDTAYDEKE